jgi:acetolactate synthase-1/3 small subunit
MRFHDDLSSPGRATGAIVSAARPAVNPSLTLRVLIPKITRAARAPSKEESFGMRHVLSALVQNQPGVLAHISGMLASRGFNIDSLAVGETEKPELSRITFVVHGDDAELEQVRKQLGKIITVVKVIDISTEDFVERDLMLVKVNANPQQRTEIVLLVEMFRGRVVDIAPASMMIEISGQERKIEAFIELMRPYGIVELARTGRIALVRGTPGQGDVL